MNPETTPTVVDTRTQVALIGAGPSGLAAARNLQKAGVPYQGFEAHTDVGGLWNIENPRSTVYESAHLISSKHTTEFTEFPMRADVADYPSHREMRQYFMDFAEHFGLRPLYWFGTRVLKVEPVGEGAAPLWRITWSQHGGPAQTRRTAMPPASGLSRHLPAHEASSKKRRLPST